MRPVDHTLTKAYLHAIRTYLPNGRLSNDDLCVRNPEWDAQKIEQVTGIRHRHVATVGETAGDMGFNAAELLFRVDGVDRSTIDTLILCTQSPDYFPSVPSTACVLHGRLGLADACAAFDVSLGCSGFTYCVWLAKALIASQSAHRVIVITADSIAQRCDPADMSTVVNFGDGAAACFITAEKTQAVAEIGEAVVGTDGSGADKLLIAGGGSRNPDLPALLTMDGPEVFSFTLHTVHRALDKLLCKMNRTRDEIHWYLLHQANRFLVESLGKKLRLPPERVPIDISNIGNTSSASIPFLLERCLEKQLFQSGQLAILAGFGAGWSWALNSIIFCAGVSCRTSTPER